jgi:hypothetical protein
MRWGMQSVWLALALILASCASADDSSDVDAGAADSGAGSGGSAGGHQDAATQEPCRRCNDDAGAMPDAAETSCLEHTIRWGGDGGLVAMRTQFSLESCATYRVSEITLGQEPRQLCLNEVPRDALITVDDINALIAADDVQEAMAHAPIVFGVDSRPVDGVLLRIEIDGAIIDVGQPCASSPTCSATPAGVTALADALDALFAQQHRVPPDCLGIN